MRYAANNICWQRIATLVCGLILSVAGAGAREDLPAAVLLVAHTLQANQKLLSRLPLYTCLETISRSQPTTKRQRSVSHKQDVIQLDIGVGGEQEIYSWPGDPTFSTKDLFALIGHGILANGLFRTFAANVFVEGNAIVKFAGEAPLDGKRTFHFTFSTPSLQNKWEIDWLGAQGMLGEQGEFWVDPANLTLLQLNVMAVDIPFNVPLSLLTTAIYYRVLLAGAERVLIPENAAVTAIERNGTAHAEVIGFSHCRLFGAESNLLSASIKPEDLTTTIKNYEAKREILPAGLFFPVRLDTPVYMGKTMVGDRISATLESPVRAKNGDVIPKGAQLKGRVREFQTMDDASDTVITGLEFDELTWPGHSAAFFANVISMEPAPGLESVLFDPSSRSRTIGAGGLGDLTTATTRKTYTVELPGVAAFFLRGSHASVPKGFHMIWRTQDVAHH
jgi:hypothetical protein